MEIRSKNIELVDINLLIPYEKNMNRHSEDQINRLIKLIEYQGFRDPLIIQKGTNIIASGHGRWEAAKKIGMKKLPVTFQEFDSEAQFYAFVVSHNSIASWSELDLDMIKLDMPDLDMELLGLENFSVMEMALEGDKGKDEQETAKKFVLQVELPNDMELRDLYDDLLSKGYLVKEL